MDRDKGHPESHPRQARDPRQAGPWTEGAAMISKFFIERPILANVLAVINVIVGMVSYFYLPVEQYPPIVPPTILIATMYPGASASVIAYTIGVPLEQAVNGVERSIY